MGTYEIAIDSTAELAGLVARQLTGGVVTVTSDSLDVVLGDPPIFKVSIPRRAIQVADRVPDIRRITRGVHGSRGKWLVNGSGKDLVRLRLTRPVLAHLHARTDMMEGWREPKNRLVRVFVRKLMGPRNIKIRELTFNVDSPDSLLSELGS